MAFFTGFIAKKVDLILKVIIRPQFVNMFPTTKNVNLRALLSIVGNVFTAKYVNLRALSSIVGP